MSDRTPSPEEFGGPVHPDDSDASAHPHEFGGPAHPDDVGDRPDGRRPRATQLDMGQTMSLLVTAVIFMFVTVYVDWIWAKVIVLILMVLLIVGLSLRIYRDRVGK